MGSVPRGARFDKLERAEQAAITRTYGPLRDLVRDAPDVCNWKPTSTGAY